MEVVHWCLSSVPQVPANVDFFSAHEHHSDLGKTTKAKKKTNLKIMKINFETFNKVFN